MDGSGVTAVEVCEVILPDAIRYVVFVRGRPVLINRFDTSEEVPQGTETEQRTEPLYPSSVATGS